MAESVPMIEVKNMNIVELLMPAHKSYLKVSSVDMLKAGQALGNRA